MRKKSDIENKLFSDQYFFDQPSASRMLFGLLRTLNQYTKDESASIYMGISTDNLNLIMNCNGAHVTKILKKPVARDMLEVGGSNGVLNAMWPYQFNIEFKELMYLIFAIGKGGALKTIESFDLNSKDGLVRLTLDPHLLDQLSPAEKKSYSMPKFLYSEKMGQIKITHTLFIEYQDTSRKAQKSCSGDVDYYQTGFKKW